MFEPLLFTADFARASSAAGYYQIIVRQLVPVSKPKLDARLPVPCTTSCHPLWFSM
jgi:hypothetical protein